MPQDALTAAEVCVAQRPDWDKSHFRRGDAHFALRLFSHAADDFRTAQGLAAAAAARSSGASDGAGASASARPDPHIAARLAAAEDMMRELRELDTEEASVRKAKEDREAWHPALLH
jgi:hypothetical protein